MPLTSMSQLLADALRGKYAVCYCEAWDLESLQGVVEAAEEMRSPIITGFNGGFLMHPKRRTPANLTYYASMATALRKANAPVAFLLNETDSLSQIEAGLNLGFNSVMVENEHLPLDDYRKLVRQVVDLAHRQGASVEAQVGQLSDGAGHVKAEFTEPASARAFVEDTGIDALAIAVGNVHILTTGKSPIDLETLGRIHEAVRIPLVLHGGTGIPLEMAQDCVRLGVAKVNFGTALKQAYIRAVCQKVEGYQVPMSPHPFLGMGGKEDILVAAAEAVKLKVKELVKAFGSAGQANSRSSKARGETSQPG